MQTEAQSIARQTVSTEPDALHLLEQFGATLRIPRNREIHMEGDQANYCYRVVSGCVRTVRLMEDGRRQVGEFHLAGDMFGFDDLGVHDLGAEAVCDTVLRRFPRRMVETLADSRTSLARRLRELALKRLHIAHEQIVLLGRKTATERLASFLLDMQGRTATKGGFIELPMGRADIADHLGLTVETVCRVLAAIKREGGIAIERAGIVVRDSRTLCALANDTRH